MSPTAGITPGIKPDFIDYVTKAPLTLIGVTEHTPIGTDSVSLSWATEILIKIDQQLQGSSPDRFKDVFVSAAQMVRAEAWQQDTGTMRTLNDLAVRLEQAGSQMGLPALPSTAIAEMFAG